jgi:hypothetical protein
VVTSPAPLLPLVLFGGVAAIASPLAWTGKNSKETGNLAPPRCACQRRPEAEQIEDEDADDHG